jgi:dimethylargininase
LRIGRRLFVGLTTRTDAAGVAALADILRPHGYQVLPVPMKKALHLKSTVTALDDETLIVHRPAVDIEPFAGFRLVDVPEEEPGAANILRLPKAIVIHQGYRRTIDLLNRLGYPLAAVDVSELIKAESGVTCSSVIL